MTRAQAAGVAVDYINVGGGIGVDYDDPMANPVADFQGFFDTLRQGLHLPEGATLHC